MNSWNRVIESYNKIQNIYNLAYEKYMYRKIDTCLLWIVENMYRINSAYEYISNNKNDKSTLLANEIICLGDLEENLIKRLEYKYVKTERKNKLEKNIEKIILKIEEIENIEEENKIEYVNDKKFRKKSTTTQIDKIKKIGEEYFKYILDTVNKDTNYLGIDFMDMSRNIKDRNKYETSPTNIGFVMVAIISAIDLKYIEKEYGEKIIKNILTSIYKLPSKDGLLYNWYNVKTFEVTSSFISSVDNGNLLASLYVLNSYFNCNNSKVIGLISRMNMRKFYNEKKNKVVIGIEDNKQTINVYDRLMSETRLTIYQMIARGEIKESTWYNLKREKIENNYNLKFPLYSWTGCAFEYFLPNIFMYEYINTKVDDSNENCYLENIKFMKENKLPCFGVSASAYPKKNRFNNYFYKEFGVPSLRKRIDKYEDYTISPHASILMIGMNAKEVLNNIDELSKFNLNGKYGLMDAIDLDTRTKDKKGRYKVAKIYYTHNVAMSIMSINNYLNEDILQARFMQNREMYEMKKILIND